MVTIDDCRISQETQDAGMDLIAKRLLWDATNHILRIWQRYINAVDPGGELDPDELQNLLTEVYQTSLVRVADAFQKEVAYTLTRMAETGEKISVARQGVVSIGENA